MLRKHGASCTELGGKCDSNRQYVPYIHAQDSMDHDAISYEGAPDTNELYLAVSKVSSAPNAHAGVMDVEVDVSAQDPTLQTALGGFYDPVRCSTMMDPPKKCFRTFWKSVSHRLLHRWAQTASIRTDG